MPARPNLNRVQYGFIKSRGMMGTFDSRAEVVPIELNQGSVKRTPTITADTRAVQATAGVFTGT